MTQENTRRVSSLLRNTYRKAIEENHRTFLRQKASQLWAPNEYWMVDEDLNVVSVAAMRATRKADDIYAAVALGALVIYAQHGDDAIIPRDDNLIEFIELKLTFKSKQECWFYRLSDEEVLKTTNPRFTLYVGDRKSNNPASFKSSAGGTYEIANNLTSKNRTTYFVLFDDETCDVIDVRQLTGAQVMEQLSRSEARKRFISYNQFLELGQPVPTVLPQLGYDNWAESLVAPQRVDFEQRRQQLISQLGERERRQRLKLDQKNRYSLGRRRAA